jgi:hypothetical protein
MKQFLKESEYVDFSDPTVKELAQKLSKNLNSDEAEVNQLVCLANMESLKAHDRFLIVDQKEM